LYLVVAEVVLLDQVVVVQEVISVLKQMLVEQ
jgi:hypothetical protein